MQSLHNFYLIKFVMARAHPSRRTHPPSLLRKGGQKFAVGKYFAPLLGSRGGQSGKRYEFEKKKSLKVKGWHELVNQ